MAFLKNNTSSASTSEGIIFDKIQGRVCFYYYRNLHVLYPGVRYNRVRLKKDPVYNNIVNTCYFYG